jgi:hypothetical protein
VAPAAKPFNDGVLDRAQDRFALLLETRERRAQLLEFMKMAQPFAFPNSDACAQGLDVGECFAVSTLDLQRLQARRFKIRAQRNIGRLQHAEARFLRVEPRSQ